MRLSIDTQLAESADAANRRAGDGVDLNRPSRSAATRRSAAVELAQRQTAASRLSQAAAPLAIGRALSGARRSAGRSARTGAYRLHPTAANLAIRRFPAVDACSLSGALQTPPCRALRPREWADGDSSYDRRVCSQCGHGGRSSRLAGDGCGGPRRRLGRLDVASDGRRRRGDRPAEPLAAGLQLRSKLRALAAMTPAATMAASAAATGAIAATPADAGRSGTPPPA